MTTIKFNSADVTCGYLRPYWAGVSFACDEDVFCAGSDPVVLSVDVEEWDFHFPGVEPTENNILNRMEESAYHGAAYDGLPFIADVVADERCKAAVMGEDY